MKTALWLLWLCSLGSGPRTSGCGLISAEVRRLPPEVPFAARCPTGQTKDDAALVQIEKTWVRAVEQHDMDALGCILANEFEEADFNGSLIDRSAMLASAAGRGTVHYELSELRAHRYGDFAYVRGLGVMRPENQAPPVKSRFTDIFVYRDGRWQCVAGHESHLPQGSR